MDQYQLMVDEEMLRLKRKYELEIDGLNVRILEIDREFRNGLAREAELEMKLGAALEELENLGKELLKEKDMNKELNEKETKLREMIKLGDFENDQLRGRNHGMEEEILILLQIESEKSKEILLLSENKKALENRTLTLEVALLDFEKSLALMEDNLKLKEAECL